VNLYEDLTLKISAGLKSHCIALPIGHESPNSS
jgi:hypothetical protein